MLALKVEKKFAENARGELVSAKAFASGFKPVHDEKFVFFPTVKRVRLSVRHSFVQKKFKAISKPKSLKELLSHLLTQAQLKRMVSSYDIVGDIAIVEIPEALLAKKTGIAKALMASNRRIKTVLRKASERKGKFRLKEYEWLAGAKKFATLHKESGCFFKVDLAKTYFSPRLSSERLRIASLAKDGERILVLFSGVSPFEIVIAKRKRVFTKGVELNPYASKLAKENVVLNHLQDKSETYCGDARVYAKKFGKWADRIVMPLPTQAHAFLSIVIENARKGSVIHYYDTGGEKEGVFKNALKEIGKACKEKKRKFKVLAKRKVLPYAPRVFQVCVDFKILS